MGSNQRGSIYQVLKMNKTGPKVMVSPHKGAEITNTAPQRGHGSIAFSTQRSRAVSVSPSTHQRSEARHSAIPPSSSSDYPRSTSFQVGPSSPGAPIPRATESRSKSEAYRHSSLQRKIQQTQTPFPHAVQMQQNISQPREEATRRRGESKSGRDSNAYPLASDARPFRHLSFADQKDNAQMLQEDPPSKVLYPQGVRVPRRPMVSPKDKAVQTEPIRKSVTSSEIRSTRRSFSPEQGNKHIFADSRTTQRRIPGQESETGRHSSVYTEPKTLHRNKNLESSLTLSVLKDIDGGHQVSMHTELEPTLKHSAYTEPKPSLKVLVSSEVESSIKTPVRGDGTVGHRVTISSGPQSAQAAPRVTSRAGSESPQRASMFTFPEPVYKQHTQRASESVSMSPLPRLKHPEPSPNPSFHTKVELTPRPLPPRSIPKYGPESSWWALLNTEVEMPQSQSTPPDFEVDSSPLIDYSLFSFEMDSNPCCEDLMFQREKASASPPPAPATPPPPPPPPPPLQLLKEPPGRAPLRGVPQAPKHTSKQPIQRFSAFFLDVSEEMYNRVIWWLKGLCFPLPWAHCGGLGGWRTVSRVSSMYAQS
ncbi:uncharacterized protein C17orf47 homolog [Phyllostomus hastatus]|uniref:uncharacterized protein C17orf47 homolog n=1 Tax=Phyllostomus hastatus TaxID=9423 RepID=UPI001E682F51|nr:uncharacterized protein C17orf47 homolog [Phyllostomus hastatus]